MQACSLTSFHSERGIHCQQEQAPLLPRPTASHQQETGKLIVSRHFQHVLTEGVKTDPYLERKSVKGIKKTSSSYPLCCVL